jgi:hypothetical protein
MRRMTIVIGAMLVAVACGGGGAADEGAGPPDTTRAAARSAAARTGGAAVARPEGARTSCGSGGDSTRAACLAFDTLMKLGHPPRTLHLVQHGGTFCVHTVPGTRPSPNGESVVEVAAGRVTRVSLADTTGCGQ